MSYQNRSRSGGGDRRPYHGGGGDRDRHGGDRGGSRDYGGRDDRRGGHGGRGGRGGDRGGHRGGGGGGGPRRAPDNAVAISNYFQIQTENLTWIQYGVDWGGAQSRSLRRKIYRQIIGHIATDEEREYCIYDGTSIFTPRGIEKAQEGQEIKVKAYELEYVIKIVKINKITITDSNLDFDSKERLHQIFNIIINDSIAQSKDFMQVRRDFFYKKPLELDGSAAQKMRIHPGFLTQVSFKSFSGENKLVLNVDLSHKIISNEVVLRLLNNIRGNRPWDKKSKSKARRELVKKIVFTNYNTQSYTIENIDFDLTPNSEFKMTNFQTGESNSISYAAYTKKIHGVSCQALDQPLLKTSGRNKQVIHLIPEFCCLTDLPNDAKQLLPKTCSVKPPERVPRICQLPQILNGSSEKSAALLSKFKIKVGLEPIRVKHRVLPKPTLNMPGRGNFTPDRQWGPQLRDLRFNVQNQTPLTIFYTFGRYDEGSAQEISRHIEREFDTTKAQFRARKPIFIDIGRSSHLDSLRSFPEFKNLQEDRNAISIVSVFSDDHAGQEDYKAMKEFCARFGYHHQGVNSRNFSKSRNKQVILGNVARQILNKFGKLAYTVPIDLSAPFLKGRSVLFIGIDLYHSKINYQEAHTIYYQRRSIKSYIGYAVSPQGHSKTFAHCVSRTGGQEVLCSESDGTSVMSINSDPSVEQGAPLHRESGSSEEGPVLGNFVKNICNYLNLQKFDLIVVYRDGVADSQVEFVQKEEVAELQHAAPDSKLAFFVVQKEIHSRFFLTANGEHFNVPSGTIIDEDCVNPQPEDGSIRHSQPRDFYLVPVDSNLSTSKPVRYLAIHLDDVCTRGDNYQQLQQLTYALCHMYPNWPDSIKVPCVTQMAHKMAYHLGEIKMRDPEIHPSLFESMFYL